jgi:hypothetical protein
MKNLFLLILLILLSAIQAMAQQTPGLLWAKNMGGTGGDQGLSIAVDASGNVYTAGYFSGTAEFHFDFGTLNLVSAGGADIFVQKQSANGNLLWAESMGGTQGDYGYSISVDNMGNVYVTGYYSRTVDFNPGPGTFNLTSAGQADVFILKLDTDGNFIWAKSIGGTGIDWGYSIAVDASGNVYPTGYFEGTADLDPGPAAFNLTSAGTDVFVLKLDSSGNLVWAKNMGGTGYNVARSIALDLHENIYMSGYYSGTSDFDPGLSTVSLTSTGSNDFFVLKLDTLGNLIWAKSIGGLGDDRSNSMAVDSSGSVYLTGYYSGTVDFDLGLDTFNLSASGYYDIFILKMDVDGIFKWVKSAGSAIYSEEGLSIAVDVSRNVYTTGYFRGTVDFDPGPAEVYLNSSSGSFDIFVQKLDNSGNLVWAESFGGIYLDECFSIAVDTSENVYTTGTFSGTADFDPGINTSYLASAGDYDIFVSKWSQNNSFINNFKRSNLTSFFYSSSFRLLRYTLPEQCEVSVKYFDIKGRKVASIVNHFQGPGDYSCVPPLSHLPAGPYLQVFKAGDFVKRERLLVVR